MENIVGKELNMKYNNTYLSINVFCQARYSCILKIYCLHSFMLVCSKSSRTAIQQSFNDDI